MSEGNEREITYIPRFCPIPPLGNIMYALAMASQDEDFVFRAIGGDAVHGVDMLREFLPLATTAAVLIQCIVGLGSVGPGDQAEV